MMHVGWITNVQDVIHYYNAPPWPQVSAEGFTQYTANQSGIPTANPNFFANYQNINMPSFMWPGVIDFLENGLTDPRVAAETFPFDRPTLHSELVPLEPALYGTTNPGTGGFAPMLIAASPLALNTNFKAGLGEGLGGAPAVLLLSAAQAAPNTFFGALPIHVDLSGILAVPLVLAGAGAGQGYATLRGGLGNSTSIVGLGLYGQALVIDAGAAGGIASSQGAHWTVN